jgi:hypothetical protein
VYTRESYPPLILAKPGKPGHYEFGVQLAARPCRLCGERIGYDRRFRATGLFGTSLVHETCRETEARLDGPHGLPAPKRS